MRGGGVGGEGGGGRRGFGLVGGLWAALSVGGGGPFGHALEGCKNFAVEVEACIGAFYVRQWVAVEGGVLCTAVSGVWARIGGLQELPI